MRKLLLFVCSIIGVTLFAAPEIRDLQVTSIAPMGLAIDYNVSGATGDVRGCYLSVSMTGNGTNYLAKTLTGATNCVDGAHRVYWNMAKDGITSVGADIPVKVKYAAGDGALYCVIDLAGGSSAASYPVTYLNAEPSGGFNTTEYKTTKLVLKRVDPGSFIMGEDQTNESHRVTLTKPFYMGLYEVTQKQWVLVTGSANSNWHQGIGKGDAYSAHAVSYNTIRGTSKGAQWPASNSVDSDSFLGKLRAKTGIDFDLPTEAQWEYTCRAGTTTTYSYGDSADGDYMWYVDNSLWSLHEVGTKLPNPWGFYDMHGNLYEWCLDRYNSSLLGGVDPAGPSSGSTRVLRGGAWASEASNCTSSYRLELGPEVQLYGYGFRLSRTLP